MQKAKGKGRKAEGGRQKAKGKRQKAELLCQGLSFCEVFNFFFASLCVFAPLREISSSRDVSHAKSQSRQEKPQSRTPHSFRGGQFSD
ncbi:MAG TPA: hypothetical protein VN696_11280 [Pyrinomonadaceae bacterium]|nr:hypothetical protein [Pyrinomonadaceae bacterium]